MCSSSTHNCLNLADIKMRESYLTVHVERPTETRTVCVQIKLSKAITRLRFLFCYTERKRQIQCPQRLKDVMLPVWLKMHDMKPTYPLVSSFADPDTP